jgi:hypothetical protein
MSRIVMKCLRRQSKLGITQQTVHEVANSQEQPCSPTKGIQPIDAPNNEPQQPIMANLPLH